LQNFHIPRNAIKNPQIKNQKSLISFYQVVDVDIDEPFVVLFDVRDGKFVAIWVTTEAASGFVFLGGAVDFFDFHIGGRGLSRFNHTGGAVGEEALGAGCAELSGEVVFSFIHVLDELAGEVFEFFISFRTG